MSPAAFQVVEDDANGWPRSLRFSAQSTSNLSREPKAYRSIRNHPAPFPIRTNSIPHFGIMKPATPLLGSTSTGPHRDDFAFTVDGSGARNFGSEGQQRTLSSHSNTRATGSPRVPAEPKSGSSLDTCSPTSSPSPTTGLERILEGPSNHRQWNSHPRRCEKGELDDLSVCKGRIEPYADPSAIFNHRLIMSMDYRQAFARHADGPTGAILTDLPSPYIPFQRTPLPAQIHSPRSASISVADFRQATSATSPRALHQFLCVHLGLIRRT